MAYINTLLKTAEAFHFRAVYAQQAQQAQQAQAAQLCQFCHS